MRSSFFSPALTLALALLPLSLSVPLLISAAIPTAASADVNTSIVGSVVDNDGVAVSGAKVRLLGSHGEPLKSTTSDVTGQFSFFPVEQGSYTVAIEAAGFSPYRIQAPVSSSAPVQIQAQLAMPVGGKEIVVNVKEHRNLVRAKSSGSQTEISREKIESLPGGTDISLPQLLSSTTPGIVAGPFGQMFIRGNHANIQYQIDGVQLPDSPSGTFGDAFSPRNIDHMEVITGGVPAEFGERTAAVVNIVTKSGQEKPGGEAELRYGSYATKSAQANYGGSDSTGRFRYFLTGNYTQTDRGLDTPQPKSYDDQSQGGGDAVHDRAAWNDEFARLDYVLDNDNKFTVNLFNSIRNYEIPTYPSSFNPRAPFFQPGFTDNFGNAADNPANPTYIWTPAGTGDTQTEENQYVEFVWKHTFNEHSFLQVSPYYKRSRIRVGNDPANDLADYNTDPATGAQLVPGAQNVSFAMDRTTNNYGLKADHTWRANESNQVKSGVQIQQTSTSGAFSIQTRPTAAATSYPGTDNGTLEAVYVEDSYTIAKPLTLNAGVRYTATQFSSDQLSTQDGMAQPRIGLDYLVTDSTKLHVFYGQLFQPAPFENLHEAFAGVGGGQATPYDIKAEKDDYYEAGVAQQLAQSQLVSLNVYYKNATNMLDDTQLLNTSIGQPYNFATGFASGVELSYTIDITPNWSGYANYSYEDARGKGISGGFFAFDPKSYPSDQYQFLDHVQLNTANAGLTYRTDSYWATAQALYGSGLRTGANNALSLPSHTTFDVTVGYQWHGDDYWARWKVAADITNLGDNAYPITVNNGFNGSHYAAGRQYFVRLIKDL